ncbi:TraR/DksA family transcriptional regulator [Candidatus Omnitrophota bacterium]
MKIKKRARRKTKKFGKKELAEFKKLILKRKSEIIDNINHISEYAMKKSQKDAAGDISGYTYHMADVATDTYDREFSMSLASNDREFLYELDDALKRIEEGRFGVCDSCKRMVTKVRLRAVPHARSCVKCAKKLERG